MHGGKESKVPRLLRPGEKRDTNEVYHFLVFDEDMAPNHSDKLMKQFWPERCGTAKNWIEKQVKLKWKPEEIKEALAICELIDKHWARYADKRADALIQTACTASVWPTPANSPQVVSTGPSLGEQERIRAELESTSGSFQRLKLVMDTWCALWFWPLNRVVDLPTRDGFLASARLLLGDEPPHTEHRTLVSARLGFEIEALLSAAGGEVPDASMLAEAVPWFELANDLACEQRFHHWELVFTEVLGPTATHQGFDLVIGNPPWIRITWSDPVVLCELEPRLGVQETTSSELTHRRNAILKETTSLEFYSDQFRQAEGGVAHLNSPRLYTDLIGMKANLYKNFIVRSWDLVGNSGVAGLLHPEGPYEDPKGGHFRRCVYSRLRSHYHHKNELQLFADVDHHTEYSINIYAGMAGEVRFRQMANLYHPKTGSSKEFMGEIGGGLTVRTCVF
jgi:hypothetical protein